MSSHFSQTSLSASPHSPPLQQQQQQHHLFNPSSSPPLPNIHSLSLDSYSHPQHQGQSHYSQSSGPQSPTSSGDYRYNGVFGPPPVTIGSPQGWDKRGSRAAIPGNWYDPSPFDYRQSSPALSPPTSSSSGPSSSSANPYLHTQPPPYPDYNNMGVIGMANTPSPPPPLGFMGNGMSVANSAPNLAIHGIHSGMPAFGSQSLASITSSRSGQQGSGWRNSYASPPSNNGVIDDDVIPTAIVIKNIPFSVPREALLSIIESLGAPLPYAFNYHHDSGVFRGLAFANFRQPDEAAAVVAALNGYDVSGRKLRVEYKKVLQPGEKDRIEREKALKRMRSVQGFDKMNHNQGYLNDAPPLPSMKSIGSFGTSSSNLNINLSAHPMDLGLGMNHDNSSPPPSAISTSTSSDSNGLPTVLDMNDPAALDIYSRCLLFKEDRMRDELSFSRNLSPHERRVVHLVAAKLGLSSGTKDTTGEEKSVVVTREPQPSKTTRPALVSSSSASNAISSTYLSPYASSNHGDNGYYHHQSIGTTPPTGSSISPGLRIKKSMPDLRGFNSALYSREPGVSRNLMSQRSSGNLRENNREYVSMGASIGRRMNGSSSGNGFGFDMNPPPPPPPVPQIPAGMGGHRSTLSLSVQEESTTAPPSRHPRGPAGESRGFGGGNGAAGLSESAPIGTGSGGGLSRGLRTSASAAVMRSSNGFGGMGMRGGVREEEEGEVGEAARTRESLDL